MPDFSYEDGAHRQGYRLIAGIDEAGRGPWAGPVVAAAVLDPAILPAELTSGLDDSKKLSAAKRDELFELIISHADFGIGRAEVGEIDNFNILQATFLAMQRAVEGLSITPDFVLIDGNRIPDISCPAEAVVKGDGKSLSIAAASIIAKVTRDREMKKLGEMHPGYGWERNMGYGTAEHKAGLEQLGVTDHHRKSYQPIINILSRQESQ